MSKISARNTLEVLLGSRTRVKVLKCLFRNYPADFTVTEVARIIQEPVEAVRRELGLFQSVRLVVKK